MSVFYAQLNEESVCIGVSQLSGVISSPLMIAIPAMDVSIVGKLYNDGVWEEIPVEPIPEFPLSEAEQTQLETALNIEYLICLMELND
ncbi:MAG: hypothetical protein PHG19_02465 [Anaerotignum sp.]|nr:hypothetical protein [Anaerotignum sp.]